MPSKAATLKRTRAQRIPFRPGDRYTNKGRIHSRRPTLSSSFFACKTAADHTFRLGGYSGIDSSRIRRQSYFLNRCQRRSHSAFVATQGTYSVSKRSSPRCELRLKAPHIASDQASAFLQAHSSLLEDFRSNRVSQAFVSPCPAEAPLWH